jgi:FHA domain-containing protein
MLVIRVVSFKGQPVPGNQAAQFGEAGGTIGRGKNSTLVLQDPELFISRTHATISYQAGGFIITDNGTKNPVVLNGQPLGFGIQARLGDGNQIQVGGYLLETKLLAAAPPPMAMAEQAWPPQAKDDPLAMFPGGSRAKGPDPFVDLEPVKAPPAAPPIPVPGQDPLAGIKAREPSIDEVLGLRPSGLPGAPAGVSPSGMSGAPRPDQRPAFPFPQQDPGPGVVDPIDVMLGIVRPPPKPTVPDHGPEVGMAYVPPVAKPDPAFAPPPPAPAAPPAPPPAAPSRGLLPTDAFAVLQPIPPGPPRPSQPPAPAPPPPAAPPPSPFQPPAPAVPHSSGQAAPPSPFQPPAPAQFPDVAPPARPASPSPFQPPPPPPPAPMMTPPAATAAPAAPPVPFPSVAPPNAPPVISTPVAAPPSSVPPTVVPAPPPPPATSGAAAPHSTRGGKEPTARSAAAHGTGEAALLHAFLHGAGIADAPVMKALTPEIMDMLGKLLREAVHGTVDLLRARTLMKGEMRADVTMIMPVENNPLKFSPNVETALTHLLAPHSQGFLPPVRAMKEAYDDLRAHQLGFLAGMRAALDDVLSRFTPKELEKRLSDPSVLDSLLPMNRRAKQWDLFVERYEEVAGEARENFNVAFGKAFLKAYEAQVKQLRSTSRHRRSGS